MQAKQLQEHKQLLMLVDPEEQRQELKQQKVEKVPKPTAVEEKGKQANEEKKINLKDLIKVCRGGGTRWQGMVTTKAIYIRLADSHVY